MAQELLQLFSEFENELRGGTQFTQGGSTKERSTEPYAKYEWWMKELREYVKGVVEEKETKRKEFEETSRGSLVNGPREKYKVKKSSELSKNRELSESISSNIAMYEKPQDPNIKIKNEWIK